MRAPRIAIFGLLVLLGSTPAQAEIFEIGPEDSFPGIVNTLTPGDELRLRGGIYSLEAGGSWFFVLSASGTAAAPIVIRAVEGEVPVLQGDPAFSQNAINLESSHLVLQGLEIRGGSHGIRLGTSSSFVTIERCHIHGVGDVGISANSGGARNVGLQIRRNKIHDTGLSGGTGEALYLGCNAAACRVSDSVIEGNYIHDTGGSQGEGVDMKSGSFNNVIRDNVIHSTNFPNISVLSTLGAGAANVIERNVLWGAVDAGIQVVEDAVVRNNIVLGAGFSGIVIKPIQGASPDQVQVVHNTILYNGGDWAIRLNDSIGDVTIANNAVYAPGGNAMRLNASTGMTIAGNVGTGALSGVVGGFDGTGDLARDFVAARLSGRPPNDVFPAPGSLLLGAVTPAHVVPDDFNGAQRTGHADVGAYRFDVGGSRGWVISPAFKESCGDVDDDGIVDSDDASTFRAFLVDPLRNAFSAFGETNCNVIIDPKVDPRPCEILDLSVIRRALGAPPLPPGIAQNACRAPFDFGPCQLDSDCAAGSWCRVTSDPVVMECVPFQEEGGHCAGFVLPSALERCPPDLICTDFPPFVVDAPGVCRRSCVNVSDCAAGDRCHSDDICRPPCVETADCPFSFLCDALTGRCLPGPCASPLDCASGFCVDGICCDSPCIGICQACVASRTGGVDGRCAPITSGTDPDGECVAPETCEGGGVPGACGCTPGSCLDAGAECGPANDGCDGTLSCGSCRPPDTCGGSGTPGICGCTPLRCGGLGLQCGLVPDGCGEFLKCGSCRALETCCDGTCLRTPFCP